MKKCLFSTFIGLFLILTGCATVPLASKQTDQQAKLFSAPPDNTANIYIYRNSSFGGLVKKTIFIDGNTIGETAPDTYFHILAAPGLRRLSTESEFGNNDLVVNLVAGDTIFLRNYIKMGVFVGGANLKIVPNEQGKKDILKCCKLAQPFSNIEVY